MKSGTTNKRIETEALPPAEAKKRLYLEVMEAKSCNSVANDDSSARQVSAVETILNKKRHRFCVNKPSFPNPSSMSPMAYLLHTLQTHGRAIDSCIQVSTASDLFRQPPTLEQIASYSQDVIKAVRDRDMDQLRAFATEGRPLDCCNRFGESLLHVACRRGFTDVVKFLVLDAKCSVFVRDDYGRTAMHDAAWSSKPNFELMNFLIEQGPALLLLSDVRGNVPFDFVRKEHWNEWVDFLRERHHLLTTLLVETSEFG